jgi:integrase
MKKTKKEHRVPLSAPAMALLAHLWEYRKSDQFVFTGRNRTSLDRKAMRFLLRDMEIKATPHGFRTSFKTWGTEKTWDYGWDLIEMCLAHQVGTEVARVYLQGDVLDKRRKLMDAWAEFCEGRSTALKADQGERAGPAALGRAPSV